MDAGSDDKPPPPISLRYNAIFFRDSPSMNPHISALFTPLRDLLRYRDRPELFALLIYQCITATGFTLLMPLVSVHFVSDVGMAAAIVGMALAIRQVSQQGLTFIGGMLADRYGLKPVLCTGLIIRAAGFFMLGYATSSPCFSPVWVARCLMRRFRRRRWQ